jgi:hypothetical protein
MIINEYILYIVLIKRGKIQLVGENRKKWYGGRLHLIHDAPPLGSRNKEFNRLFQKLLKWVPFSRSRGVDSKYVTFFTNQPSVRQITVLLGFYRVLYRAHTRKTKSVISA